MSLEDLNDNHIKAESINGDREFVYYIDGNYYIIGYSMCRVCDDEGLIEIYQHYKGLTENEEFLKYDCRSMVRGYCNDVALAYKSIIDELAVPMDVGAMSSEESVLFERLIVKFSTEIEDQISIRNKADDCLSLMRIKDGDI